MIRIVQLKINDTALFRQMVLLFSDVFEEPIEQMPSVDYINNLLSNPGFAAFVALDENTVVGGITAHEMPGYYSETSELYIYDLAVHPNSQRKGTGEKLVRAVEAYAKNSNIKTIFVQTYEEEKEAILFYENVVGKGQNIVHFEILTNGGKQDD